MQATAGTLGAWDDADGPIVHASSSFSEASTVSAPGGSISAPMQAATRRPRTAGGGSGPGVGFGGDVATGTVHGDFAGSALGYGPISLDGIHPQQRYPHDAGHRVNEMDIANDWRATLAPHTLLHRNGDRGSGNGGGGASHGGAGSGRQVYSSGRGSSASGNRAAARRGSGSGGGSGWPWSGVMPAPDGAQLMRERSEGRLAEAPSRADGSLVSNPHPEELPAEGLLQAILAGGCFQIVGAGHRPSSPLPVAAVGTGNSATAPLGVSDGSSASASASASLSGMTRDGTANAGVASNSGRPGSPLIRSASQRHAGSGTHGSLAGPRVSAEAGRALPLVAGTRVASAGGRVGTAPLADMVPLLHGGVSASSSREVCVAPLQLLLDAGPAAAAGAGIVSTGSSSGLLLHGSPAAGPRPSTNGAGPLAAGPSVGSAAPSCHAPLPPLLYKSSASSMGMGLAAEVHGDIVAAADALLLQRPGTTASSAGSRLRSPVMGAQRPRPATPTGSVASADRSQGLIDSAHWQDNNLRSAHVADSFLAAVRASSNPSPGPQHSLGSASLARGISGSRASLRSSSHAGSFSLTSSSSLLPGYRESGNESTTGTGTDSSATRYAAPAVNVGESVAPTAATAATDAAATGYGSQLSMRVRPAAHSPTQEPGADTSHRGGGSTWSKLAPMLPEAEAPGVALASGTPWPGITSNSVGTLNHAAAPAGEPTPAPLGMFGDGQDGASSLEVAGDSITASAAGSTEPDGARDAHVARGRPSLRPWSALTGSLHGSGEPLAQRWRADSAGSNNEWIVVRDDADADAASRRIAVGPGFNKSAGGDGGHMARGGGGVTGAASADAAPQTVPAHDERGRQQVSDAMSSPHARALSAAHESMRVAQVGPDVSGDEASRSPQAASSGHRHMATAHVLTTSGALGTASGARRQRSPPKGRLKQSKLSAARTRTSADGASAAAAARVRARLASLAGAASAADPYSAYLYVKQRHLHKAAAGPLASHVHTASMTSAPAGSTVMAPHTEHSTHALPHPQRASDSAELGGAGSHWQASMRLRPHAQRRASFLRPDGAQAALRDGETAHVVLTSMVRQARLSSRDRLTPASQPDLSHLASSAPGSAALAASQSAPWLPQYWDGAAPISGGAAAAGHRLGEAHAVTVTVAPRRASVSTLLPALQRAVASGRAAASTGFLGPGSDVYMTAPMQASRSRSGLRSAAGFRAHRDAGYGVHSGGAGGVDGPAWEAGGTVDDTSGRPVPAGNEPLFGHGFASAGLGLGALSGDDWLGSAGHSRGRGTHQSQGHGHSNRAATAVGGLRRGTSSRGREWAGILNLASSSAEGGGGSGEDDDEEDADPRLNLLYEVRAGSAAAELLMIKREVGILSAMATRAGVSDRHAASATLVSGPSNGASPPASTTAVGASHTGGGGGRQHSAGVFAGNFGRRGGSPSTKPSLAHGQQAPRSNLRRHLTPLGSAAAPGPGHGHDHGHDGALAPAAAAAPVATGGAGGIRRGGSSAAARPGSTGSAGAHGRNGVAEW
jgi:hypothetical protein